MTDFDEDSVFGAKPKKVAPHEIGQNLDAFSAAELAERIDVLRAEIARLERAIEAREATRAAAAAAVRS
jgi:uncharacterized small protein (DUF1192 family)